MSNSRPLLAIEGGQPIRTRAWPSPHQVDDADREYLLSALNQSNWSDGETTREFERRFASFVGVGYALLLTNGTSAARIGMRALGVGPGDEVVVPGITWPSIVIAVLECGAEPVPADVDSTTYGLTPETVAPVLSARTKAIVATHLFCSLTDLPPLLELARERDIHVIEDAAHAVGARRFGAGAGSAGIIGVFSFNQKKLLACGEGGCLITNDDEVYLGASTMRQVEIDLDPRPLGLPETCLASDFQAAVLLGQLEKLPERLKLEENNAEFLRAKLDRISGIEVLRRLPHTDLQTFYNFCFNAEGFEDIHWVRSALSRELGLGFAGAYPPLSEQAVLQPQKDRRYRHLGRQLDHQLPNCSQAHNSRTVRFHHSALTAGEESMLEIEAAVHKVTAAARIRAVTN